uniref:Uncharacterized protein n=1 Tax=Setaria digitata TaxID=48799 RepID=A0A915Q0V8_9BILA
MHNHVYINHKCNTRSEPICTITFTSIISATRDLADMHDHVCINHKCNTRSEPICTITFTSIISATRDLSRYARSRLHQS